MCSDLYLLDRFSLPFSLSLPLSFVRLFVLFAFPFFSRRPLLLFYSKCPTFLIFRLILFFLCVNFCLSFFFFPEEKKKNSDPQTARLNPPLQAKDFIMFRNL